MTKLKSVIAALVCAALLIPVMAGLTSQRSAQAVSSSQLNDKSVFLKQKGRYTCTLCANVMMLRRAAMLRGDSDWDTITESSARSTLWIEDVGMINVYSFHKLSVTKKHIYGNTKDELKNALKEHPEGIVAYDYDYPHAILLTDYTDGKFYCADPANNTEKGRITVDKSLISAGGVDCYWYVTTDLNIKTLKNCSSVVTKKAFTGLDVQIKAKAKNAEGECRYTYYYKKSKDTDWTRIGKKNTKKDKVSFRPDKKGKYDIRVTVKDSEGNTSDKLLSVDVKKYKKVVNNSTVSKDVIDYGKSVTINAKAKNGTGEYRYNYFYRLSGTEKWHRIGKTDVKDKKMKFAPENGGIYELKAVVKDSAGKKTGKVMTVVAKSGIKNDSVIKGSEFAVNKSVFVQGAASESVGEVSYSYYFRKSGTKKWVVIAENTNKNRVYFVPKFVSTYEVKTQVRDITGASDSSVKKIDVRSFMPLNSYLDADASLTDDMMTVNLFAEAYGGSGGYEYSCSYKAEEDDEWTDTGITAGSPEVVIIAEKKSVYDFRLTVKDSEGNESGTVVSVDLSEQNQ